MGDEAIKLELIEWLTKLDDKPFQVLLKNILPVNPIDCVSPGSQI